MEDNVDQVGERERGAGETSKKENWMYTKGF